MNTSLSPGHARWGGAVALLGLAVGLVVAMLLFSPGRVPHSESAFWTALFFKGAVQSYDAELAAAFASPDLVLRIHPPPAGESGVYAGRESLRGWIRHAQRENLSFERYFILPEGNTVTFRGSSSQPDWAEQGIEARRTNTEVVVENGKVREFVLNFEPPIEEIPVAAENWFASALAALAALVALQRKDSAVRQNITSRAPYRALAAFCLLVSVYFGANVYAYNNWGAVDLARLGLIELLRAGAIGVAIWMALRMEAPTWSRVAIVIWALLFGAGFGLGMAYIVPLAVAGLAVLLLALLPQFHGSPESAPGGMEQPLGQGQRLEAEPSVR